jgi:hypothetical protein
MTVRRIKKQPEETPEEFFNAVQVPDNWQFICWDNHPDGYGKVYELKPGLRMRLILLIPQNRGCICERDDRSGQRKYHTIVSNKRSWQLNEFIQHYFNNEEDDNNKETQESATFCGNQKP